MLYKYLSLITLCLSIAVLLHFIRSVIPKDEQSVVFVATKHDVEYLRELLLGAGIDSSFVYSSLDQTGTSVHLLHTCTCICISWKCIVHKHTMYM